MMRPDLDHVPTLAEVEYVSPAAERKAQSPWTWRLVLVAGTVGGLVVAVAILVIPAVAS